MVQKSTNGGMGMKKHGVSGNAGRSPKFKHARQREANKTSEEEQERKGNKKRIKDPKNSVSELFSKKK